MIETTRQDAGPAGRPVWGIIPAAGIGRRMGAGTAKQYLTIAGRTLLEHAAAALLDSGRIRALTIAHHAADACIAGLPLAEDPRVRLVVGGATRAESVCAAMRAIAGEAGSMDWVLVHDAARPCLTAAMVVDLLQRLDTHPVGGLMALPIVDTVKQADELGNLQRTLPRETLWRAQTPQVFRYHLLQRALSQLGIAGSEVTDEAMALERLGCHPVLVTGSSRNIKVTIAEDLALAEWLIERHRGDSCA